MPAPVFLFGCVFVMAKKLGDSQPGFSDTSGLGTKSLKSLIQSAVEKALEAERARTVSAGLTSSGEYTVEISPKTFWDDEPRLSRRYLRKLRTVGTCIFIGWSRARTLLMNSIQYGCHVRRVPLPHQVLRRVPLPCQGLRRVPLPRQGLQRVPLPRQVLRRVPLPRQVL